MPIGGMGWLSNLLSKVSGGGSPGPIERAMTRRNPGMRAGGAVPYPNRAQTVAPTPAALGQASNFNPMMNYPGYGIHEDYSATPAPPSPMKDPLQALIESLTEGGGGEFPAFNPITLPQFDPNRYKSLAEQSVNAQFNPVIQGIYAQQKATQGRAASNKAAVGSQYAGMAASFGKDLAASNRMYDTSQAQSQKLYEDERNRIAAGYAADAAAQRAAAKRLGTEALGVNEAIAKQDADKQFALQQAGAGNIANQQAYEQQQLAAADYDRGMAEATRAEGAEQQADIARQLEDYMTQSGTNLANVQSQRAGSINDLMYKLAEAGYQRDIANAQFGYQQQRDYLGDVRGMASSEMDTKLKQLQLMLQLREIQSKYGQTDLNSLQKTSLFANQLAPGQGQDYISGLLGGINQRMELSGRPGMGPGNQGTTPLEGYGGIQNLTPEAAARLVADSAAARGLDRNVMYQIALQYFSQGKG